MKLASLGIDFAAVGMRADAKLTLKDCADKIRACQTRVLDDCFTIGRELLRARERLRGSFAEGEHEGLWLKWLRDDVQMSHHQARRFISVAEKYGGGRRCPPLSFSVLAELAAPDTSPDVAAAVESASAPVTVRQVRALKKVGKRKPRRRSDSTLMKACVAAEQDIDQYVGALPANELPSLACSFELLARRIRERIQAEAKPNRRRT